MWSAERRAQSTEHRAQSAGRRAKSEEQRAQSTGHRAQSTGREAKSAEQRAQSAGREAWGEERRAREWCNGAMVRRCDGATVFPLEWRMGEPERGRCRLNKILSRLLCKYCNIKLARRTLLGALLFLVIVISACND